MRSDEGPKLSDVLKQTVQNDVRAYATFWMLSRLCRQMHISGLLTDDEVEKIFDPEETKKQMPDTHKEAMRELIQNLKDYCFGRTAQPSGLQ